MQKKAFYQQTPLCAALLTSKVCFVDGKERRQALLLHASSSVYGTDVIGQHPLTILQGSWPMRLVFVDFLVPLDSMSFVIKFDPDHAFDDEDQNNDAQFPRIIMGWAYTQPQQWRRV